MQNFARNIVVQLKLEHGHERIVVVVGGIRPRATKKTAGPTNTIQKVIGTNLVIDTGKIAVTLFGK